MSGINVKNLTAEEKAALLAELQADASNSRIQKREAYEGLRSQFVHEVQEKVTLLVADVKGFHSWIEKETKAFSETMKEYGQVKSTDQMNFTITDGNFKLEVKASKVKAFDERADLAAERLIDYLKRYMQQSEKGADDPMYQMAMTLLERNKMGDLDYKSISKLYELEDKFDQEYADIMTLFKESNQVQKTAINYYFHERGEDGIWRRVEPSFCRM